MTYDSTQDTEAHIATVQAYMKLGVNELKKRSNDPKVKEIVKNLNARADVHDQSKLVEPEKTGFDIATPKLKALTYGSPEYEQARKDLQETLAHHYAKNSHHPEHYAHGIDEMDLFDLFEMTIDWLAASQRHADGNIAKSLDINQARFQMSDQLTRILLNTYRNMGWI